LVSYCCSCTVVELKNKMGAKFGFQVEFEHRSLFLWAASEKEREEWCAHPSSARHT
jgi:hypothetical protein